MERICAKQYIRSLLCGKQPPLRIALLGGSLTKGEFAGEEESFAALLERHLPDVLGKETLVFCHGQSGTTSANALYQLPEVMEEKPDLVFVDYSVNDPGDRYLQESTEAIAYQLMERGIGVVFLLFCTESGRCNRGAIEKVGRHYQVPVYDIGQYVERRVRAGELRWSDYAMDYVHPTAFGHEMIGKCLNRLFTEVSGGGAEGCGGLPGLPEEPCFTGAFFHTHIWDMNERLRDARPGDVVFDGEIEAKMILVETWQDCLPNPAGLLFSLDGRMVYGAEAYGAMAWGNPVCRYLGGDGTKGKYRLTVALSRGTPPDGWNASEFRLRILIGI